MGRDQGFATGRGRLVCNDVDDRGVELEKNLRHYVPPSMWEVDADGAAVAAVAAAAAAAAAAGVATGVTSAAASAAFLGPELSVTFTDGRDFGHGKASSGSSSASAELGSNSGVNGGGSSPITTKTSSSSSSGSSSTTTSAASTATTTTGINNNKGGAFDRILIDAPCTTDKHLILSSDAAVARQLPLLHNNMYPPLQVRHTMCSCNSSCSYSQSVYSGYDVHNYLLEQYNTTCLKEKKTPHGKPDNLPYTENNTLFSIFFYSGTCFVRGCSLCARGGAGVLHVHSGQAAERGRGAGGGGGGEWFVW